jgi:hypothetical protein
VVAALADPSPKASAAPSPDAFALLSGHAPAGLRHHMAAVRYQHVMAEWDAAIAHELKQLIEAAEPHSARRWLAAR